MSQSRQDRNVQLVGMKHSIMSVRQILDEKFMFGALQKD